MDEANRVQTVLLKLFRPLARVMIQHGITISMVTELFKRALVDVAESEDRSGGHLTDSRVSLITGLHRKDVRRLRREEPQPAKRSFEGGCALAIAYWTADKRFLDSGGKPKKLVIAPRAPRTAFSDLVQAAGLDVPASTVLDELERAGVVVLNQQRTDVTLVKRAYLPEGSSPAKLGAFEKNLEAHLIAASANLVGDDGPFFERAAHFNNLSVASVEKLNTQAGEVMQKALETLNRSALTYQNRDSGKPENTHLFSFGAYVLPRTQKAESQTKAADTTSAEDDI